MNVFAIEIQQWLRGKKHFIQIKLYSTMSTLVSKLNFFHLDNLAFIECEKTFAANRYFFLLMEKKLKSQTMSSYSVFKIN